MTWMTVRLELARTPAFPHGSPARSFVLRLPIGADGVVDQREYGARPEMATVRRFWPNEPDRRGYIVPTPAGWALSSAPGGRDGSMLFQLDGHVIRQGICVTLTEPSGEHLPFEVKALARA